MYIKKYLFSAVVLGAFALSMEASAGKNKFPDDEQENMLSSIVSTYAILAEDVPAIKEELAKKHLLEKVDIGGCINKMNPWKFSQVRDVLFPYTPRGKFLASHPVHEGKLVSAV